MVLFANKEFSDDKAIKVYDVLIKGSKKNIYNNLKYKERLDFFMPLDRVLTN